MENLKMKRWPFVVSGILLMACSIITLFEMIWECAAVYLDPYSSWLRDTFFMNIIKIIFRPQYIISLVWVVSAIALALVLLFRKKSSSMIFPCAFILLTAIYYLLEACMPDSFFKIFIVKFLLISSNCLNILSICILMFAVYLGIRFPKNIFTKITCFLPALTQLLSGIAWTISIFVYCSSRNTIAYYVKYWLIRDFSAFICIAINLIFLCVYFIALVFVGVALQSSPKPVVKKNKKKHSTVTKKTEPVRETAKNLKKNTVSTQDRTNEIRNYKKLLDEGVITEEEFLAKKRQLMEL